MARFTLLLFALGSEIIQTCPSDYGNSCRTAGASSPSLLVEDQSSVTSRDETNTCITESSFASLLAVTTLADPAPAAPQLTEQQKNVLAILFFVYDKNGDFKITADELKQTLEELDRGKTTEEVEEMIKKYDRNGKGAIDFDEFFVMMAPKNAEEEVQHLQDSLEFVAFFQEERDSAAPQFTEEQEKSLAILAILFNVYDKDGDHKITADELKQTLEELGRGKTTEEVEEMIRKYDRNGKGAINFFDFFVMMAPKNAEEEVQNLKDSFHYFDKNRDGFLDDEEVKFFFESTKAVASDDDIRKWIEKVDKDNDGRVSEAEFVAIFHDEK